MPLRAPTLALRFAATLVAGVAGCQGQAAGSGERGGHGDADVGADRADAGVEDEGANGPGDLGADATPSPTVRVDLVDFARLTATGTRTRLLFVREAEDGIASVRDDSAESGWWIPEAGAAKATIDWRTVLRRGATLATATVEADGDVSGTWSLYAWCGGPEVATVSWGAGVVVNFDSIDAGCATLEATGDARVLRVALMADVEEDALPVQAPSAGGPAVSGWGEGANGARFGVVEGFYGAPWTWRERRRIAAAVPYAYAPKLDPLHRAEWRTPYPDAFVEAFAELAPFGAAFGISPFIDYDPDSDATVLEAKLAPLIDAGVRALWLLADDIELETERPIDASLGELHATVVNQVGGWASARAGDTVAVTFVPTVYSDQRRTSLGEGDSYLRALRALDPSVAVAWTGQATFSPRMTHTDLDEVAELIGRVPVVWDNFWANDGGDGFNGRITMGPYRDRLFVPTADRAVVPVFLNPAIQGTLAHAQLAMALADSTGELDAERARSSAVIAAHSLDGTVDVRLRGTLETAYAIFDARGNEVPAFDPFEAAVDRLESALDAGTLSPDDVREAAMVFATMATLQSDLYFSRAITDLVDELWTPLERVRLDGEQGLFRLMQLRERLSGRDAAAWDAEADARALSASRERFVYSVGAIDRVATAVSRAEAPALTARDWRMLPMPACIVGEPFAWTPFDGPSVSLASGFLRLEDNGQVHGLAEAPGTYRAVVAAVGDAPVWWEIAQVEIVCAEEEP